MTTEDDGSFRIPEGRCPECGYELTGASTFESHDKSRPAPGDFSVCIDCAAVLCFDEKLQLRKTTIAERSGEEAGALERAVRAVQMANLMRRKP